MAKQKEEKTKVQSVRFPKDLHSDIINHTAKIKTTFNRYLQDLAVNDLAQAAYQQWKKRKV
jgi:hypothetical protein